MPAAGVGNEHAGDLWQRDLRHDAYHGRQAASAADRQEDRARSSGRSKSAADAAVHARARSGTRRSFTSTTAPPGPSPVTDGEVVVVHFGNGDLAAYDFAGNQLWKHNLQDDYGAYTSWYGHANSPVIAGDLVISRLHAGSAGRICATSRSRATSSPTT